MAMKVLTPFGAVTRGAFAGAVGTAAMDLLGYARHRAGGGDQDILSWEFRGPSAWNKVSAPGHIGKRLFEGYTQRTLEERWSRTTHNVVHWGYGIAWGALFGVLAGSRRRAGGLAGPLFGSWVWATGYALLPLAGLYKPVWEYSTEELASDLAAHLAYGTGTAMAFRIARVRRVPAPAVEEVVEVTAADPSGTASKG